MLSAFCAINSSMYFPLYFLFYSLSYYQEGKKKSRCSSDKYLFFWAGRLYTLEKRAFQSLEVNEENFRRNQRMSSAEKHYLMQAKKYVIFVIHSSAHISVFGGVVSAESWIQSSLGKGQKLNQQSDKNIKKRKICRNFIPIRNIWGVCAELKWN